jgi:hypothetical protein
MDERMREAFLIRPGRRAAWVCGASVLKTAQSNKLYVQRIGEDDRIKRFESIDIGDAHVTPHDFEIIRGAGDLALWAFQMVHNLRPYLL